MQGRVPTIRVLSFLCVFALSAPLAAHDLFKKMDTNHDGKISAAEHTAAAQEMFNRMDSDHDGKVTAAEAEAGHDRLEIREAKEKGTMHDESMDKHRMSGADMVKAMDTDGDGTVSASEHAAEADKMFARVDANHDGFMTADEMKTAHMAMQDDMANKSK